MNSVVRKALTLLIGNFDDLSYLRLPKNYSSPRNVSERELIQRESAIGRELFGPVPKGVRREFFCLDKNTCIWYEEHKAKDGKLVAHTTKYEIHDDKVLKVQEGAKYSYLEGDELKNLLTAIGLYYEKVMRGVYKRDPRTGQPLA